MPRLKRVILAGCVAALLASCAAPKTGIVPRLSVGEQRTYLLRTESHTVINVPGLDSEERTLVEATVKVEIVSEELVRVTLTPSVFRRDGRDAEKPPDERADLTVDARGNVLTVTAAANTVAPLGGSEEDLATLLGGPFHRPDARLGDRWSRSIQTRSGRTRVNSRLSGLRFVDGRRCAIIATASSGPAERARQAGGQNLRLTGTDTSFSETAFAFDDGIPISIRTNGEGNYKVEGGRSGSVVLRILTTVRLASVTRNGSTVSPSSPTATGRPSPRATATATR